MRTAIGFSSPHCNLIGCFSLPPGGYHQGMFLHPARDGSEPGGVGRRNTGGCQQPLDPECTAGRHDTTDFHYLHGMLIPDVMMYL